MSDAGRLAGWGAATALSCCCCVRVASQPASCLPAFPPERLALPSGDQWWHEIKHDGIRLIARKEDKRIKLYSRPGNDLTKRFPQIVEALARLRSRSCILDGEAVACGEDGIALFERIRYRRHDASVFMWAFDLIELDGDDLRREPLERRKAAQAKLSVPTVLPHTVVRVLSV
jgi:bifunctional non-homologous end joining protein LigD